MLGHSELQYHARKCRPVAVGDKAAAFLRQWDKVCKTKRKQLLQRFINRFSTDKLRPASPKNDRWEQAAVDNQNDAHVRLPLDAYLGHSASLVLSRFSSYLRLTYSMEGQQRGFSASLVLQAIGVFLSVPSVKTQQFVHEIMSSGILTAALEILLLHEGDPWLSHLHSLELLYLIGSHGRQFKETLCEFDALPAISSCMRHTESEQVQRKCTKVLLELATGNPQHLDTVRDTIAVLLPLHSRPLAQQSASQVVQALFDHTSPHFVEASMNHQWCDRLVAGVLGMHRTESTRIGLEAGNIAARFAERQGTGVTLAAGLAVLVESRCVSLYKEFEELKAMAIEQHADTLHREAKKEFKRLTVMINEFQSAEISEFARSTTQRSSIGSTREFNDTSSRFGSSEADDDSIAHAVGGEPRTDDDLSTNKTMYMVYSVLLALLSSTARTPRATVQHTTNVIQALCGPRDQTLVTALGIVGLSCNVEERIYAAHVVVMLVHNLERNRVEATVGLELAELLYNVNDFMELVLKFWRANIADPPHDVEKWSYAGERRDSNFELVFKLISNICGGADNNGTVAISEEKRRSTAVPKASAPVDEEFARMHLEPLAGPLKELLSATTTRFQFYNPF